MRVDSVDSESTLAKFAKQNFGCGLFIDANCDDDNIEPSGKGEFVPSEKGAFSRRGKYKPVFKPFYNCYGIDVAPINIFENQVISVGIHNILKSFKPNLDTI